MYRRSALVAVSALGLAAACLAGAAPATATPANPAAAKAPVASPNAGYVARATGQVRPALGQMTFTVPPVTCVGNPTDDAMMSVWAGLNGPTTSPGRDHTVALGVQAQCIPGRTAPAYRAFWQLDTDTRSGRQLLANRAQRGPGDLADLPVKVGEHLIATVELQAGPKANYVLSLSNPAENATFRFADTADFIPTIAECLVDAGPRGSQLPLAKFGTVKVTTCKAGPETSTGYAAGYLAVPLSSSNSVHHKWGWAVARDVMESPDGHVLAAASAPTNSTAGRFTVVWRAAS